MRFDSNFEVDALVSSSIVSEEKSEKNKATMNNVNDRIDGINSPNLVPTRSLRSMSPNSSGKCSSNGSAAHALAVKRRRFSMGSKRRLWCSGLLFDALRLVVFC